MVTRPHGRESATTTDWVARMLTVITSAKDNRYLVLTTLSTGVDLNRNFPRQFDEPQHDFRQLLRGREPETAAAMLWVKRNPFVLSANLHAGAVVASYPFDDSPSHQHGPQ